MTTFEEMGICVEILKAIEELGFMTPMPVQEEVIPKLLHDQDDLQVLAQTGTGKTAAFGLPVIQQLAANSLSATVLILTPTRELCVQICQDLTNYAKYMKGISIAAVYGGVNIENQKRELSKRVNIIVATPGRLLDMIRRKYISLKEIKTLVLDEADEMLDMGFKEDLDEIIRYIPVSKRTLLFSATMSKEVGEIAKCYMQDPLEITIGVKNSGTDNILHYYYLVNPKNRYLALKRIVDYYPHIYAIVFCRTKIETQEVATALIRDGYNADALHGDLSQAQRDHVMQRFRVKNLQILVATDVAARGLDVHDLTHVINYNLPSEAEQYNHRSGRTGRAHKKGIAISILTPKEVSKIERIERLIHQKIELIPIPSGKEVCEKQLFHMINEMEHVVVNYPEIESYLPIIYKKLAWMDKEELIRRFVSVEFNRFLDYYRSVEDIHTIEEMPKEKRKVKGKEAMSQLRFGLGYKDHVVPQRLIAFINEVTKNRDIRIGKIDISETDSYVSIENQYIDEVVSAFSGVIYKGVPLKVEKVSKKTFKPEKKNKEERYRETSAYFGQESRKGKRGMSKKKIRK